MKKFILILLLFLLTTSCNKYIVQNVFERTYPATEISVAQSDVYTQLNKYGLDSIPFISWITNNIQNDSMRISQRLVKKTIDSNTMYQFIFTEYTPIYVKCLCPEKYQFVVRYSGKKK